MSEGVNVAKTREQMYEDQVEEETQYWMNRTVPGENAERLIQKYKTIDASDGMVVVQRQDIRIDNPVASSDLKELYETPYWLLEMRDIHRRYRKIMEIDEGAKWHG